jgi:hypothetical protein
MGPEAYAEIMCYEMELKSIEHSCAFFGSDSSTFWGIGGRVACEPLKVSDRKVTNPCPCGFSGDPSGRCHCSPAEIQHCVSKISDPLLDRIDIHIEIPAVKFKEL